MTSALAGGSLAHWMRIDRCSASNRRGGECGAPSAAMWESPNSHLRSPLCASHVDSWFDVCDLDPDLEPASVRWLDGSLDLVGLGGSTVYSTLAADNWSLPAVRP